MGRSSLRANGWRGAVVLLATSPLLTSGAGAFATSPSSVTRNASSSAGTTRPVSWVPLSPKTSPTARAGAAMAFDPAINKMVLFGGAGPRLLCGCLADTWTYDGTTWTRQFPAVGPSPRAGAAMAYDPALGKLVLFGGNNLQPDTWTYDGTTWAKQSPATSPPARVDASIAYDPALGKIVLFGGYSGSAGLQADTWTYDGATWTQQSPASSPPPRSHAAMAFDPASGGLVLFGGFNGHDGICEVTDYDDTWTYDGVIWKQQSPTKRPSARADALLANDPATGQLVLFGGDFATGSGLGCERFKTFNETWTYNGATWSRVTPSVSPAARTGTAIAYYPPNKQLILFGGVSASRTQRDTWAYQIVGSGYRFVASDGGVFAFAVSFHGSTGNVHLNQPIVGIAAAPNGQGYWLVAADGAVFNFGPGAVHHSPKTSLHNDHRIVGMAVDPTNGGYWLVATDGHVFPFDVPHRHFAGSLHINRPIVGMAADAATGGYWLVADDGGVFAFDAPFYGSTGNLHLNQPIVGMAAAPDSRGYWLVAKDGGIFSFGPGAVFHGSTGNMHLNQPIVGMTGT